MSKIKVVMCPTDRAPYVTNISDSLGNMQRIVEGNIETITLTSDVVLICCEEGRIANMPENKSVKNLIQGGIVGVCFFCGYKGDAFESLSSNAATMLLRACKKAYQQQTELEGGNGNGEADLLE